MLDCGMFSLVSNLCIACFPILCVTCANLRSKAWPSSNHCKELLWKAAVDSPTPLFDGGFTWRVYMVENGCQRTFELLVSRGKAVWSSHIFWGRIALTWTCLEVEFFEIMGDQIWAWPCCCRISSADHHRPHWRHPRPQSVSSWNTSPHRLRWQYSQGLWAQFVILGIVFFVTFCELAVNFFVGSSEVSQSRKESEYFALLSSFGRHEYSSIASWAC